MRKKKEIEIDPKVVLRYLSDEGTPEDKSKIEVCFSTLKGTEALKKESLHYWNNIQNDQVAEDYEEERMLDHINHLLRIEDARINEQKRRRTRFIRVFSQAAAILFLPLMIFSYLSWSGFFDKEKAEAYSSIYSPLGARTNFFLPDGSKGWLNGGSTLRFPVHFSGKFRALELEGEAFFEVQENARNPFVVSAGEIKVVALGTSFNVNAYEEDGKSQVALVSGKVELFEADDKGLRNPLSKLDPGVQFVYFKELDSHLTEKADLKKATSWKEGKLIFRNDPMTEIVRQLNRWYNADITIADKSVETYTYRATFEDETLDEILKFLELSSPITVTELERDMLSDNTFGKRKIVLSKK